MQHILLFCFLISIALQGTFSQNRLLGDVPSSSQPGSQTAARAIQNLHYSVSNQEQEIANLKQKIQNQETILDSMHSEVTQLIKSAKESQKSTGAQVDTRLKTMEKNLDKLLADIKQFKTHANDTSKTLTQIEKKLQEQEEIFTLQAQQIKDLESALRHLAGALSVKSGPTSAPNDKKSGEYRVKSGDTLEKIAKDNGTTIDAIKRENNLQKDIIYPGQKLQIP